MQSLMGRLGRALLPCAAIVLAVGALTQHAQAQISAAQQDALRSNCRSDFMARCSGETPGSKGALLCLQRNVASLSPGCKAAVSATMPPPAAAKPPPPAATPKPAAAATPPSKTASPAPGTAQTDALSKACGNDYLAHCANVPPGGKEAVACLRQNAMQLSVPCKQVLSAMMTPAPEPARKKAVRATPPPAAAPPPAAVPVPVAAGPTPQQLQALKFTCRRDFRVHCRGVPAGGQEAFACLMRNSARLTPDCRTSIRAIEESAPTAPAATAVAPAQPTAAQQAALKQNCSADFPRVCPGVSPGPAALTCLQTRAAQLSPACQASVAALGGTAAAAPAAAPKRPLPPGITPAGRVLRRIMEHNR